jgi:hypothetical protein
MVDTCWYPVVVVTAFILQIVSICVFCFHVPFLTLNKVTLPPIYFSLIQISVVFLILLFLHELDSQQTSVVPPSASQWLTSCRFVSDTLTEQSEPLYVHPVCILCMAIKSLQTSRLYFITSLICPIINHELRHCCCYLSLSMSYDCRSGTETWWFLNWYCYFLH